MVVLSYVFSSEMVWEDIVIKKSPQTTVAGGDKKKNYPQSKTLRRIQTRPRN